MQLVSHQRLAKSCFEMQKDRLPVACTFPVRGCPIRGTLYLLESVLKCATGEAQKPSGS